LNNSLKYLDKVDHRTSAEATAACFRYVFEELDGYGMELYMYSDELLGVYDQLRIKHGISDDELLRRC